MFKFSCYSVITKNKNRYILFYNNITCIVIWAINLVIIIVVLKYYSLLYYQHNRNYIEPDVELK